MPAAQLKASAEIPGQRSDQKPLALEMQDTDLMALTAALNQIFRQDEEFRRIQNRNENEYKELITNISHDLRTPLTVLKGYLQLLERCEIDDTGRKYLSICFRHTDELERRIRQFSSTLLDESGSGSAAEHHQCNQHHR